MNKHEWKVYAVCTTDKAAPYPGIVNLQTLANDLEETLNGAHDAGYVIFDVMKAPAVSDDGIVVIARKLVAL